MRAMISGELQLTAVTQGHWKGPLTWVYSGGLKRCSTKVQQPARQRSIPDLRGRPVHLRRRPSLTLLPIVRIEGARGSNPLSSTEFLQFRGLFHFLALAWESLWEPAGEFGSRRVFSRIMK
jgi:hypothetical protein